MMKPNAFVREIMKESAIRVQNMRLLLMDMRGGGNFVMEPYDPKFILDLIK